MKYDNPITPSPRRRTDVIKCLNEVWRHKSLPPPDNSSPPKSTTTSPKSPISKAFDFLPWSSRHKSTPTTTATKTNNHTAEQNYHKNIFRNSGGIIRDILSDKLNKDKGNQHHGNANGNGNGKKFKYTSRNKSLDINELINNCTIEDYGNFNNENDDNENDNIYRKNGFIDDTYIEELMDSNNNHDNNNNSDNATNNNGKHILFNNENVVHVFNGKKSSCSGEKSNGTSIIKARLKFQKLNSSKASSPQPTTVNQKSILTRNSVPSPSRSSLPSNHPALNYQRSKSEMVIENRSSNENDADRPKTVKPRKKLSFREPIASHLRMKFQDGRFQVDNANNKKQQGGGIGSASACDSDLEVTTLYFLDCFWK